MVFIQKGLEPQKLTQYRVAGGTWNDFSKDKGKEEVQNQLLQEQNNLCAYCLGRISAENMKIEHWYPRSLSQDETSKLEYRNLLGVCPDNFKHCDTTRKEKKELQIDPRNPGHIQTLVYDLGSGNLKSNVSNFQNDIDNELCLNVLTLKLNRTEILKGINKRLKSFSIANLQRELNSFKDVKPPYYPIAIQYLEKKIRQFNN